MSEPVAKRPARIQGRPASTVAALDIGCLKTTCLIARPDTDNPRRMTVLGGGRHPTRGFTGGNINIVTKSFPERPFASLEIGGIMKCALVP